MLSFFIIFFLSVAKRGLICYWACLFFNLFLRFSLALDLIIALFSVA